MRCELEEVCKTTKKLILLTVERKAHKVNGCSGQIVFCGKTTKDAML